VWEAAGGCWQGHPAVYRLDPGAATSDACRNRRDVPTLCCPVRLYGKIAASSMQS